MTADTSGAEKWNDENHEGESTGTPEHTQAQVQDVLAPAGESVATAEDTEGTPAVVEVVDQSATAGDAEQPVEPAESPSVFAAKAELTITAPPSFFGKKKEDSAESVAESVAAIKSAKPEPTFIAAAIHTKNPAGEKIKMVLFFQIDEKYSLGTLTALFEQNREQFGDAECIEEIARFNTFGEMESYAQLHGQTEWNGKDIYWWPAQQLPSIILN